MIIHIVESGETLTSIAQEYGIDPEIIISVNELPNPDNLVVGQSIAIRIPDLVHTVVQGDTIQGLASQYGVTELKIMQNNPWVAAEDFLSIGDTIIIRFQGDEVIDSIIINGYAYPFIDRTVLRKTLPFLTYLSIFNYGFTPEGDLIAPDDEELIGIAQEYNVAPAMVLAPMTADGAFSSELASAMFANEAGENQLIENIVTTMQTKGYKALDIDFEFIPAEDRAAFLSFITKAQTRLSQEGFLTFVALAPKTSGEMTGVLYEAHDYPAIGAVADKVLLMTYEWGYTYGPPMATSPINSVRNVLNYGTSVIPREKIWMGVPNYAYDWPLPFVKGVTAAESIGNQEAIQRAAERNVTILFDEVAQSPYYYYTNEQGIQHVVWFDDVRSMNSKMRLIPEYSLNGAGVWQIMKFFPGLANVVGALFAVVKV